MKIAPKTITGKILISAVGVLISTALNAGVNHVFNVPFRYFMFIITVLATAAVGGWVSGVCTVAFALAAIRLFFSGDKSMTVAEIAMFVVVGGIATALIEKLRLLDNKLKEAKETQQSIIDGALDAIVSMDKNGNIVNFNPSAEKMFGYSAKEIITKPFSMLLQEDYLWQNLVFKLEEISELYGTTRLGVHFPMQLVITKSDSGGVVLYTALIRDNTIAKQYTSSLELRQAELTLMFDSSAVAHVVVDLKSGRITKANERFCELLGYSKDELERLSWSDITHPHDLTKCEKAYAELVKDGSFESMLDKRYMRRNGVVVYTNKYMSLLRDPETGNLSSYEVIVDNTERRRHEAEIAESEQRFHSLANSAPVMIWMTDLSAELVWVNQAWKSFTGRSPETDFGNGWTEILHPDDFKHTVDKYWYHFQNKSPYQVEFRLKKYSGEYRHILASGIPRFLPNGDFAGFIGTCADITEMKDAEINLKGTIAARTEQLQNATDEWESFSHSIAHDMRSPLRSIMSNCIIFKQDYADKLGEEGVESLSRIEDSTDRMQKLIENLLTYAKLGNIAVKRKFVNISKLAEEAASLLKEEWPSAIFKITPHLTDNADADLLMIILRNLMENSCKYSDGIVTIEVGRLIDDTKTIYYVKDNGMGFDMKHEELVFKPFERLHNKHNIKGTGIGLANVQKIVARFSGKCWVESKENEGSTFYFTLN